MSTTEVSAEASLLEEPSRTTIPVTADAPVGQPRDLQRTFRLVLATIWLLDAVLQIQPFMFTPGANGFSGMLKGLAAGNPGVVYHTVVWNASIVQHHPVLTNTLFALIQFAIAFGIVYRRTCKWALGGSILWALGVWWFGEAAGELFTGGATPLGGGPGGVLFYAVLAVLLWPSDGSDHPFAAARTVGTGAARAIWAGLWSVLAVLSVVGAGRSPSALSGMVMSMDSGEPGWLAHLDRYTAALLMHDGTGLAIGFAVLCLLIGAAAYLPAPYLRAAVVVAVALFAFIWVGIENFGGILAGGATDPNSGLLVIVLALAYWPVALDRAPARTRAALAAKEGCACC